MPAALRPITISAVWIYLGVTMRMVCELMTLFFSNAQTLQVIMFGVILHDPVTASLIHGRLK